MIGADGSVINQGLLNAARGGSVTLLGKKVRNEGVISATLGQVNLAVGKQAWLTFNKEGTIGVKITQEVLQNDLGIDPALVNSGEINAQGGKVLLTASVSRDVFSQAVNSGNLSQATSVVVNADGSMRLKKGADVLNTGVINVSSASTAGEVVVLGENISHTGSITADVIGSNENDTAGNIELHANNIIELKQNSVITARAETAGSGGKIKILGDKVGLLDSSMVDASGANGGGEVLVGGDKLGENKSIRNADFLYMSENAKVYADAVDKGNGGKIITFADNTARVYEMLNLEESWKSDEQELFEFIEGEKAKSLELKLDVLANGKLARITNDEGIQPILYLIKSQRMKIKYKNAFYKNKQGEWIYIM